MRRFAILSWAAFVVALPLSESGARNLFGTAGGTIAGTCAAVSVTYGTVVKYNSGYPTKYIGSDEWYNTWDSNGNNIAAHDDSFGWQGAAPTSNFAISQLSNTTTATTGTIVNAMAPWGTLAQLGSDGLDFKAAGIISVNGTLIVAVTRATGVNPGFPYQYMFTNDQLIKSTDHGATWTPLPPATAQPYASPMFTVQMNGADFIQYGQDYGHGSIGDSNSGTYVYAMATEGPYNNANFVYLGRVSIANIANLNAADWSFYTGGDGMLSSNWSTTWANAAPIMQGTKTMTAAAGTQYFPTLGLSGCYIRINWWYPSVAAGTSLDVSNSVWVPYAAPHPWGPWVTIGAPHTWNSTGQVGLFAPHIMPASLLASTGSVSALALCAGDFMNTDAANGDYTLTMVPVTFTQH